MLKHFVQFQAILHSAETSQQNKRLYTMLMIIIILVNLVYPTALLLAVLIPIYFSLKLCEIYHDDRMLIQQLPISYVKRNLYMYAFLLLIVLGMLIGFIGLGYVLSSFAEWMSQDGGSSLVLTHTAKRLLEISQYLRISSSAMMFWILTMVTILASVHEIIFSHYYNATKRIACIATMMLLISVIQDQIPMLQLPILGIAILVSMRYLYVDVANKYRYDRRIEKN